MSDLERLEELFFQREDKSAWIDLMKEYERHNQYINMIPVCQDRQMKRELIRKYIPTLNYQWEFRTDKWVHVFRKLPNNIPDHIHNAGSSSLKFMVFEGVDAKNNPFTHKMKINPLNRDLLTCDIFDIVKPHLNASKRYKVILDTLICDVRSQKRLKCDLASYFDTTRDFQIFMNTSIIFHGLSVAFRQSYPNCTYFYNVCKKPMKKRLAEYDRKIGQCILNQYLGVT